MLILLKSHNLRLFWLIRDEREYLVFGVGAEVDSIVPGIDVGDSGEVAVEDANRLFVDSYLNEIMRSGIPKDLISQSLRRESSEPLTKTEDEFLQGKAMELMSSLCARISQRMVFLVMSKYWMRDSTS